MKKVDMLVKRAGKITARGNITKKTKKDMSQLPRDCITKILSFTTSADVCSSSLVCKAFKLAADSDVIWDSFLQLAFSSSSTFSKLIFSDNINNFSSKKDLYFRLCNDHILLDGGNKSLKLDKNIGRICLNLGPKELTVDWGNRYIDKNGIGVDGFGHRRDYWRWTSLSNSRFVGLELMEDTWSIIKGNIKTQYLSPKTTYKAFLVFKFGDYAFGFHDFSSEDPLETDFDGYHLKADVSIEFVRGQGIASGMSTYNNCWDSWMDILLTYEDKEIEIGTFYVDESKEGEEEVEMIVKESRNSNDDKCRLWKDGIIIEGIVLRPQ